MPDFKERDLPESTHFHDPVVSIHVEFKFTEGFKVDSAQTLTALVRDLKIVHNGEIIKSNLQPIWLRSRPNFLLFPIEQPNGIHLPADARVRISVAQNVPHLITVLPSFWTKQRIWANL